MKLARRRRSRRPGDAHHEREVLDEAVADAEDDGPQRPGPARPVPPLAGGDVVLDAGPARPARRSFSRRQISACSRSSAAIAATSGEHWLS